MGLGEVVKSVYGNLKSKVDSAKNYLPSPKYLIAASAISLGLTFGYNDKARALDNIPISNASLNQEQPSVAFDGLNYLVAWRDARGGSGLVGILLGLFSITKLINFNKRDYFKFNGFRRSE